MMNHNQASSKMDANGLVEGGSQYWCPAVCFLTIQQSFFFVNLFAITVIMLRR